jgi:hypothetical protein
MSNPLDVPRTQNTAPVFEFRCLYTSDLRRKQKRWQDGRLKYHSFNKRVMVYDEKSNFVGDVHWREDHELCDGEELQLERGGILVQVEEKLETHNQDLSELVDKPRKEKEARAAARTANGSPGSFTGRAQNHGTPTHLLVPKALNSLLTPSGHHGRAQVPIMSPFEERQKGNQTLSGVHSDERPSKKRRRKESEEVKSGFAQNLTGAMLNLASSKPSSTPTIHYEAFKAKFSAPQKHAASIDQTSDDNQEVLSNTNIKSNQRQHGTGNSQARVHKPKHRRSPPAKSGYASHLTGVALALNGPPPTASTRPEKSFHVGYGKAPMLVEDHQSKAGESVCSKDVSNHPTHKINLMERRSPAMVSGSDRQRKPARPSTRPARDFVSKSPSPSAVVIPRNNTKPAEFDTHSSRAFPPKASSPTSKNGTNLKHSIRDYGATNRREPRPSIELGTNVGPAVPRRSKSVRPKGFYTPEIANETPNTDNPFEDGKSPQDHPRRSPSRKREKRPQKVQAGRSMSCNGESAVKMGGRLPTTTELSDTKFKPTGRVLNTSVSSESALGNFVPTLRIKSRQPRKMMMLMDRSNPSVTRKAKAVSTNAEHDMRGDTAPKKVPALSQATIELDSLIQRQEDRIQARLYKSGPRPSINIDDLSSPPPEPEIIHENTEQLYFSKVPPISSTETISVHLSNGPSTDVPALVSEVVSNTKPFTPEIPSLKVAQVSTSSPTEPGLVKPPLLNDMCLDTTDVQSREEIPMIHQQAAVTLSRTSLPLSGSVPQARAGDTLPPISDPPSTQKLATTTTDPVDYRLSSILKEQLPETARSKTKDESTPSVGFAYLGSGIAWVSQRSACVPEKMLAGHQEPKVPLPAMDSREKEDEPKPKQDYHGIPWRTPSNGIIDSSNHTTECQEHFEEDLKMPQPTSADARMPTDEYEQSTIATSQFLENADPNSTAVLLTEDEPIASADISTVAQQPPMGAAIRTINSFGSRWQGTDTANGSDFALSIATSNQPKFKLSKPVPRVLPLAPSPPKHDARPAARSDNLSNGSYCESGGMPVTATGPWSREAFDLFGFWRPVNNERTGP